MLATIKTGPVIDFDKEIPSPESLSADLRADMTRFDALSAELVAVDAEIQEIRRELADQNRAKRATDPVAALIDGVDYVPSATMSERIGNANRKQTLIRAALDELADRIREKRAIAGRKIAAEFKPEAEHLAREFYKHLAAAIGVHAKFGQMRMRLERAGVDAGCLYDFAKDLLGSPEKRDDHAGFALRDAVRRNFIDKSDVPAGYV